MTHPNDAETPGPVPSHPDPRRGGHPASESIPLTPRGQGGGEVSLPRIVLRGTPGAPASAGHPPIPPGMPPGTQYVPPQEQQRGAETGPPSLAASPAQAGERRGANQPQPDFPAAAPENLQSVSAPLPVAGAPNAGGEPALPPSADHLFEEPSQAETPGATALPEAGSSAFDTGDSALAEGDLGDLGLDLLDGLDGGGSPMLTGDAACSSSNPRHMLEQWLATMVEAEASDLILRAGGRPSYRVHGKISFLPGRVPEAGPLLEVLEGIVGPKRMEDWRLTGSVDVALELDGLGRFRLNGYRQMGSPALVLRRVGTDAPALDSLNLPSAPLKKIVKRTRGLFLVTGIAGSGKSTTLAAMLQYLNNTEERHIVTLEDPVETLYTEDKCVISQREVGTDCQSFHDGLRHALRQSPDLILIGEMRDAETVSAALDATETGHMVVSTLHTVNAPQTMDRILGFFPVHQHKQICQRMAENLAGVLSMRLLATTRGDSRVPACELMSSTPQIRELLSEGKTSAISRVIEQGVEPGQVSFNQSLRRLVEKGLIELDTALAASDRPDELLMALRGISGGNSRRRAQGRGDGRLRMAGDS